MLPARSTIRPPSHPECPHLKTLIIFGKEEGAVRLVGSGSELAVLAVLESGRGQTDHALAASASAVPPIESFLRHYLDETVSTVTHVHKTSRDVPIHI